MGRGFCRIIPFDQEPATRLMTAYHCTCFLPSLHLARSRLIAS